MMTPAERDAILQPIEPAAAGPHAANRASASSPRRSAATWLLAIVLTVLAISAARLVFLKYMSPYDLIEDEAHYWEWSRRLDLSYYSKGPGIALAIRAATGVFGDGEWAVRLPAVVAGAITLLATALMAADAARTERGMNWRVGLWAMGALALAPMLQFVGLISTIDGPYVACWAIACWAAWRAMERRGRLAWVALGAALGVGFLFKYTILLLVPGLVLYATLRRSRMRIAPRAGDLCFASAVVFFATISPVLIWNARHGWPTLRHLLGHLGAEGGDVPVVSAAEGAGFDLGRHALWLAEFVGGQIGLLGPALVLGLVALPWALRRREVDEPRHVAGRQFLLCCAAPIIAFYLVVAFFAEAEGNWAMGGYVTLLALAGWYASVEMPRYRRLVNDWKAGDRSQRQGIYRREPQTVGQIAWQSALVYGILVGVGMLWLDQIGRLPVLKEVVPLGRLMGAQQRAHDAAEWAAMVREQTGREPMFMAVHYGRTSQLAYYLPGHPTVFCLSSRFGGRRTQYDFWPQTDPTRRDLHGRPAVLVGASEDQWSSLFDRVEPIGPLKGEHKEDRLAFLGYGYRGPGGDAP